MDKYIYMCHGNIVSSNHNKISYSAPRTIHIYILQYNIREQISIWYAFFTNTYVEPIQSLSIKISANSPR